MSEVTDEARRLYVEGKRLLADPETPDDFRGRLTHAMDNFEAACEGLAQLAAVADAVNRQQEEERDG